MSDSNEKPRNDLYEERVSEAKVVRKIVFYSVIGLAAMALIAIISGYFYFSNALGPVDSGEGETVEVTIPIGSSSTQIGQILEEEGLINNGTIFRYYVRYKNESGFQAGTYALSTSMTMDEMIQELKEGRVIEEPELIFTIPEGRWLEDVAVMIANETGHDAEEVMSVLNDEEYLEELINRFSMLTDDILQEDIRYPLEGYLFPARYDFLEAEPSIQTVIEAMLSRTQEIIDQNMAAIEESDYSVHEILALASIIEREAQTSEDRYKIAGVLHNRLDDGMRLEVDPTVAYAIGEHRYMTTFADLEVQSPYNTYRNTGIPIGPIANPGEDAIKAAINPEDTNYLFFYARYNGEVIYNETYEAHNRTHQQYREEWVEAAQDEGETETETE
ncbi:endolytic transglycosylase MltG [Alkalihalophilus pseudofirmus]|uniref:Endolytic murein transglycosylase n=1 Tax=Alkalihalophilus pseudofirmus TaxID=79885 RepID=A0AAJ2NMI1_ALKPS|nr:MULTISPECIES: endolytic transglycosylase MltG [Alkalihalophilus]MDV2883580.1 endolytic transglycosylase MltG [Alkalihalophilus pseudofirmus]MED1600709.1 endolytic transglycosylase MltG [Alkalihalophilus marmarensis]